MPTPVAEFDFNMPRAVLDQLVESFDRLVIGKLTPDVLASVADKQGIYQLYLGNKPVYIGKTDGDLKGRLMRHYYTLAGRANLKVADCGFKGLYLHDNWAATAHEDSLLKKYQGQCEWNNSGFGSNDPGRNRDNTEYPDDAFDVLFPIDLDWRSSITAGDHSLFDLLLLLKEQAPYTIRFETGATPRKPHADCKEKTVNLKADNMTVREIMLAIATALGPEWQLTAITAKVILYKEKSRAYPRGVVLSPAC